MVPHRRTTIGSRTRLGSAVASAALLGVALAGCGGTGDTPGDPAELAAQNPATRTPGSTASRSAPPPTSGAPASGSASQQGTPSRPAPTDGADAAAPRPAVSASRGTETTHAPSREPSSDGAGRCHTAMLDGSLTAGNPGAGQRYATLRLVNTSGQACKVYGYPGLQLIGSGGNALPTEVERTASRGPRTVLLGPDEASTALLHWGAVPTGDEPTTGPCRPDPQELRVIPPDETTALVLDWPFGPVCGGGHIAVTAFH